MPESSSNKGYQPGWWQTTLESLFRQKSRSETRIRKTNIPEPQLDRPREISTRTRTALECHFVLGGLKSIKDRQQLSNRLEESMCMSVQCSRIYIRKESGRTVNPLLVQMEVLGSAGLSVSVLVMVLGSVFVRGPCGGSCDSSFEGSCDSV